MAAAADRYRVPGKPLNLAEAFLGRLVKEGRGEHPAVVADRPDGTVATLTYRELDAAASRFGALLKERGVRKEERVLIVLEDDLAWPIAFFGAQRIGAVTAFVNPALGDVELSFHLADTGARALVTRTEIAARISNPPPDVAFVCVDDTETEARLAALSDTLEPAATTEEDFAIWLYTSGSTGAPKAAVHRAKDFVFNTERYPKTVLEMNADDVTVSVPKLFFGYATGANLLFTLYFGGTAVLFPDKPTPERLIGLVERHRATLMVNVPTMIARIGTYLSERDTPPDLSSLRLATSAGEALPPQLYQRWVEATGVEVLDGIGSAEMFHVYVSARKGEVVSGSLGKLVEGYEVRIVDPEGKDVPDGEVGRMVVGGGSSAAFYWGRAEESREVLQGYWVRTSDLVRRDAEGLYWYQGRANETLKIAGRWVQPQEVEACLTEDPAVAEAALAVYAREGLNKPMAFVVLAPGASASEALFERLRRKVADELGTYKSPRFVEAVDSLPRGDRDKLDRPALDAAAAAAAAARFGAES